LLRATNGLYEIRKVLHEIEKSGGGFLLLPRQSGPGGDAGKARCSVEDRRGCCRPALLTATGEALTGECIGQPLSRESTLIPGADVVPVTEGNTDGRDNASAQTARCGLRHWHVRTLFAWEPGDLRRGARGNSRPYREKTPIWLDGCSLPNTGREHGQSIHSRAC
jgi:hypothetical protein